MTARLVEWLLFAAAVNTLETPRTPFPLWLNARQVVWDYLEER